MGCLPRVRLMKNRDRRRPRRSNLWKARGQQSSGGMRPGATQSLRGHCEELLYPPCSGPPSSCQERPRTGRAAASSFPGDPTSQPGNRPCRCTEHRWEFQRKGHPPRTAPGPGVCYTVHHHPKLCSKFFRKNMRGISILKGSMNSFANLLEQQD